MSPEINFPPTDKAISSRAFFLLSPKNGVFIAKQLKILFGGGFTEQERASYKMSICTNVVTCMRTLIEQSQILDHPMKYEPKCKEFTTEDPVVLPFSEGLVEDVEALWADEGIQANLSISLHAPTKNANIHAQ